MSLNYLMLSVLEKVILIWGPNFPHSDLWLQIRIAGWLEYHQTLSLLKCTTMIRQFCKDISHSCLIFFMTLCDVLLSLFLNVVAMFIMHWFDILALTVRLASLQVYTPSTRMNCASSCWSVVWEGLKTLCIWWRISQVNRKVSLLDKSRDFLWAKSADGWSRRKWANGPWGAVCV